MSSIEHDPGRVSNRPDEAQLAWMKAEGRAGRRFLGVAVLIPLIAGVFTVAQAWWLATILDRAIVGHAPAATQLPALLALVGILVVRALLAFIGERAGSRAAEDIKLQVRRDLYAALMARLPEWRRGKSSGALASQIVDQVEALDGYFARFLPAMIAAAVLPIAFAIGLLPIDLVIGLLFLVTAPLIPVFMALVGWGAEAASRRHMTALSRLSGLFADRLRGMLVLKLFGRAEDEIDRVKTASDELAARTLSVLRIAFLSSAVLEFFAALGVAGVALYVGLTYLGFVDLRGGALGLRAGLFCLLMAPEVYLPLRTLAAHYHDRAAAKAAVADIAAMFETLPEPGSSDAGVSSAQRAHRPVQALPIAIHGLTIRAPERGLVLDRATLDIAAGEHVALLGESGIGKSSLIEAVARLRSFEGSIVIGERELGAIDEDELRAEMALLGQRPRLFHGTIASNIRLGRWGASDAEIRRAAMRAGVTDFADRLPDGLDTAVGERGRGLSGGEAQRVALARIFLRDPAILLLDEPTSHLDRETEARVLDALVDFAAGRTLLVATHSLAVARRMDRIYRIAGGRILPVPHRPPGSLPRAESGEGS